MERRWRRRTTGLHLSRQMTWARNCWACKQPNKKARRWEKSHIVDSIDFENCWYDTKNWSIALLHSTIWPQLSSHLWYLILYFHGWSKWMTAWLARPLNPAISKINITGQHDAIRIYCSGSEFRKLVMQITQDMDTLFDMNPLSVFMTGYWFL